MIKANIVPITASQKIFSSTGSPGGGVGGGGVCDCIFSEVAEYPETTLKSNIKNKTTFPTVIFIGCKCK